jgi:hypothetical protein
MYACADDDDNDADARSSSHTRSDTALVSTTTTTSSSSSSSVADYDGQWWRDDGNNVPVDSAGVYGVALYRLDGMDMDGAFGIGSEVLFCFAFSSSHLLRLLKQMP